MENNNESLVDIVFRLTGCVTQKSIDVVIDIMKFERDLTFTEVKRQLIEAQIETLVDLRRKCTC